MKTLVTGATGFIGRHLVRRLVKEGRSVTCLVRETSDVKFLEELGVELVYGDLLVKDSLKHTVENEAIDTVYHIAGAVYAWRSKQFHQVNVRGTKNLLDSCSHCGLKKFVYLSSIAVNGLSKKGSLISETSPCNPFTPYGKSKLNAENLIINFFADTDISATIIRTPVVYGPDGQSDLLTRHFKSILQGRAYMIGDGVNLRSLCYIDNLIYGLLLAEKGTPSKRTIYVVADDRVYSFKEIANTTADVYNIALDTVHLPSLIASIAYCMLHLFDFVGLYSWRLYSLATMNIDLGCDTSHAKEKLGYHPRITLREGIKKTVQWCKEEGLLHNSH